MLKIFKEDLEKLIIKTGIPIFNPSRSTTRILLRQAIYVKLREKGLSYPEIGELFNKDHTTILHSVQKAKPNNPFTAVVNEVMG